MRSRGVVSMLHGRRLHLQYLRYYYLTPSHLYLEVITSFVSMGEGPGQLTAAHAHTRHTRTHAHARTHTRH
jgi:hypothetical protein